MTLATADAVRTDFGARGPAREQSMKPAFASTRTITAPRSGAAGRHHRQAALCPVGVENPCATACRSASKARSKKSMRSIPRRLLRQPRAPEPDRRVGVAAGSRRPCPRAVIWMRASPSLSASSTAARCRARRTSGRLSAQARHARDLVRAGARACNDRVRCRSGLMAAVGPSECCIREVGLRANGVEQSYERHRLFRSPALGPQPLSLMPGPRRIVCLTEEPTEVLYAIRRTGPHRRHLGIYRAAATCPPREAQGLRFHQRQDRRDPQLELDFVVGFFRHPGRYRARVDRCRRRGLDQQSPLGRRHPRLYRPARRTGRRRGQGGNACAGCIAAYCTSAKCGLAAATAATRLLRGVGRADDLGYSLGRRARAHRRWRRHLSGTRGKVPRESSHHRHSGGGDQERARHHLRQLVRQEIPAGAGRCACEAGCDFLRCAMASCTKSSR